jgi:hypothetical protein
VSNPTKASWTDPTLNTDGSTIGAGEITGYTIGVRLATGVAGTYPYTATVAAGATSDLLSALSPVLPTGVSLIGAVQALSATNGNSAWSAESAPFEILAAPNPPTGFTVS